MLRSTLFLFALLGALLLQSPVADATVQTSATATGNASAAAAASDGTTTSVSTDGTAASATATTGTTTQTSTSCTGRIEEITLTTYPATHQIWCIEGSTRRLISSRTRWEDLTPPQAAAPIADNRSEERNVEPTQPSTSTTRSKRITPTQTQSAPTDTSVDAPAMPQAIAQAVADETPTVQVNDSQNKPAEDTNIDATPSKLATLLLTAIYILAVNTLLLIILMFLQVKHARSAPTQRF